MLLSYQNKRGVDDLGWSLQPWLRGHSFHFDAIRLTWSGGNAIPQYYGVIYISVAVILPGIVYNAKSMSQLLGVVPVPLLIFMLRVSHVLSVNDTCTYIYYPPADG